MKNSSLILAYLKTFIFILTVSIFITGCAVNETDTKNKIDTNNNTSSDLTLNKNNNFSYKPLKKSILDCIKDDKNYYYFNTQTKIVLYYNGAGCDTIKHFQETMNRYKNSSDWNKAYTFVGFNVPKSGCLPTRDENILKKRGMVSCYSKEWKNFELLIKECDSFCVVNLEKNLYFRGNKVLDEYIYNVLYDFYYK